MTKKNCEFLSKRGTCGELSDDPCAFEQCASWKNAPLTKIINCTNSKIMFTDGNGLIIRSIFPTLTAKCSLKKEKIDFIDGIPVYQLGHEEVENLPAPADNTIYIVPVSVARAVPEREDVFILGERIIIEELGITAYRSILHI